MSSMMLLQRSSHICSSASQRHLRHARCSGNVHTVHTFHSLPAGSVCKIHANGQRMDVRVRVFNFKFGKQPAEESEFFRTTRGHYSTEDVEDYFNYMGMLAVEGTYDKMYAMLNSGLEAPEILLLWACAEDDFPKVEELLGAGALVDCKNLEGKRPEELAKKPEILDLLQQYAQKQSVKV